jgi:alpha-ribazole phosphatase
VSEAYLWVARHAPAIAVDTCYGRSDVPVRTPPETAAALLIDSFDGPAPTVVWSSGSSRCRSVAQRLATHFEATLRIDPALQELDFGSWEGRSWSEIAREDAIAYERWARAWQDESPPGGERPRELEARVRAWLAASSNTSTASVHALVAHAGVVRALRVAIDGRSWPEAMDAPVPHLTWTRFVRPRSCTSLDAGSATRLEVGGSLKI